MLDYVICLSTDKAAYPIKVIGIRHGEKMYETLLTVEEAKAKIEALEYIQNELKGIANITK